MISILILLSLPLFFILFLKYYEKKGIYFPIKRIASTPKDIGIEFENVYFFSSDGTRLNGWYVPVKKQRLTILFCHGNAGNIGDRVEIIGLFHRIGLDVFIFDYRGYGKSQGRPSEKGFYSDAQAAYEYLTEKRKLAERCIVVYGKSIGGNVAINLCSKVSPAALISDSAFTSTLDMGKKLFPFLPIKWLISVKYDALSTIKNIFIPKLIIHAQKDEIIPFQHGKRLFSAAPDPKEFYQMRGGHNDAIFLTMEDFTQKINTFISMI